MNDPYNSQDATGQTPVQQSQHPTGQFSTGQYGMRASQVMYQRPAPARGKMVRRACLSIGGAMFAFGVVASIVSAIIAPPVYRNMEPLQQEIWCNRAQNVGMDFVCDWKPTPPFEVYPTLASDPENSISPEDLLLTPFDFDSSTDIDAGSGATPVSADGTLQSPPALATFTPLPQPTNLPANQATPLPTASALPPPTVISATATPLPPPPAARLDITQLRSEKQRWNNCGPTTLTMALSYFGYTSDQQPAASYLKPNIEDKNVSPWQMINYVNQTAINMVGTKAIYRVGGNLELLKTLIAHDFPVIIEKGYEVSDLGWMGHYLLVVGYDDSQQNFFTFDSYLGTNAGQGRPETYDYVKNYWRHFNYTYIVVYKPEREQELAMLLGDSANPDAAAQVALEQARADANANPNDKWAWMNMTNSFVALGQYSEAASAFDQALKLQLPWRLLWYQFAPFEAYYHMGRYDDIIQLAANLDRSSEYYVEEAWYYRGLAYAAQGKTQQAITEMQRVLTFNRNYGPAVETLSELQNGTFSAPVAYSGQS